MADEADVITPELVLVDPELAALARAALPDLGARPPAAETWAASHEIGLQASDIGSSRPIAPLPKRRLRLRYRPVGLLTAALAASIALNLALADNAWRGSDSAREPNVLQPPSRSAEPPKTDTVTDAGSGAAAPATQPRAALPVTTPGGRVTRELAERRVLASLGGTSTLRALFVDPLTGLPLPRVATRCLQRGPSVGPVVFRCTVWRQLPGRRVKMIVDYRSLRSGRFSIVPVIAP